MGARDPDGIVFRHDGNHIGISRGDIIVPQLSEYLLLPSGGARTPEDLKEHGQRSRERTKSLSCKASTGYNVNTNTSTVGRHGWRRASAMVGSREGYIVQCS